jgi:predicted TPR repeat methyltransferase
MVVQSFQQAFAHHQAGQFQEAFAHHQAGQFQEAERLYRTVLQANPTHPDANHNLGVLAMQARQPTAALPYYKAALEANPSQGQYWLSYIEALIQAGLNEAARKVLEQGRQGGLQGEAVKLLAARLGRGKKKSQTKPGRLDTSSGKSTPHSQGGPGPDEISAIISMVSEGSYAEAELLARTMTINYPQHAFGWKALGGLLWQTGRSKDALAPMQRAAFLSPRDAEVPNNLGNALKDLGRLDEAEAAFRQALQLKPDFPKALYNLGNTLRDLRRPDEAEAFFFRALKIEPDYAEAHHNLGCLLLDRGALEDAITHFERTLLLAPQNDSAKISLCQTLYLFSRLDYEKAKQLALRYKELFPEDQIVLRGIMGILPDAKFSVEDTLYAQKLFDGFAATFDTRLAELNYNMPLNLADELGLIGETETHAWNVLDAGCGTGLCGAFLRPVARTLVGVDLSPEMLRVAAAKHVYDALHQGDIVPFMQRDAAAFDLIVSADVLPYIGDVRDLVQAMAYALRQDGTIAISAESIEPSSSSDTFALQTCGRYHHSISYLKRCFEDAGLVVEKSVLCTVRIETGIPVPGCIIIARKLLYTSSI